MSKTAYEIESELKGSAVDRTGFGGRPELINFYVESAEDLSALPVLDKLTIDALRCGKIIPLVTFIVDDGVSSWTGVCNVEVVMTEEKDAVIRIKFICTAGTMTFTVETGEWTIV